MAGSGAALVVGFTLPASGRALAAKARARRLHPQTPGCASPADNRVTVVCGSSEMGQGVLTAIPQLMAEELDADWAQVSVEQAPVSQAFANPAFGMQATGGSTTVRGHWDVMRNAGATARAMLVAARGRAVEGVRRRLPYRSRPRDPRQQETELRPAGRSRRETEGTRKGRAQGPEGFQDPGPAQEATGHHRQDQRSVEVRHRRAAARHAGRGDVALGPPRAPRRSRSTTARPRRSRV